MNELISIIVPIYNVELFLEKCLTSLVHQTYENTEIILVDDGSTDNSLYIANKFKEKYPNIKLFHKKNEGLGLTRNYGLKYANGEYIVFVDSDDYLDVSFCETMYSNLKKHDLDYIKCGFYRFDKEISDVKKYPEMFFEGDEIKEELLPKLIGSLPKKKDSIEPSVWGCMFKHSIIKENNICFVFR